MENILIHVNWYFVRILVEWFTYCRQWSRLNGLLLIVKRNSGEVLLSICLGLDFSVIIVNKLLINNRLILRSNRVLHIFDWPDFHHFTASVMNRFLVALYLFLSVKDVSQDFKRHMTI